MSAFQHNRSFAIASVCLGCRRSSTQHPGSAAREQGPQALTPAAPRQPGPPTSTVEFENDKVVVLRVRMEVHERTPLHDVTPEGSGLADASAAQGHFCGRPEHRVAPSAGSGRMGCPRSGTRRKPRERTDRFLAIVPK